MKITSPFVKYSMIVVASTIVNIPMCFISFGSAFVGQLLLIFTPVLCYAAIGFIAGWLSPEEHPLKFSFFFTAISLFGGLFLSIFILLQKKGLVSFMWFLIAICYFISMWGCMVLGRRLSKRSTNLKV